MPVRNTPLVPGEFYHVYNRGNSRQIMYRTLHDYVTPKDGPSEIKTIINCLNYIGRAYVTT